ncbi:unnamed protein product, partial [Iphiclides podalirius]
MKLSAFTLILHIQNYDGPIYLHAPISCKEDSCKTLHVSKDQCHQSSKCDTACSCVSRTSPLCVPINTASESSCAAGSCYFGYPCDPYQAQSDTKIYYALEKQWNPTCPSLLDCTPLEHATRDRNQHCCKCACRR